MPDYLTTGSELSSIANAIRAKGGTSSSLEYPNHFVSAIEAIDVGTDVSDTTAVSGDVLSGKYFYTANGTKTQGTIPNVFIREGISVASRNMIPDGTDTSNGYVSGKYLKNTGSTTSASLSTTYISEYFPVVGGQTYTWGAGSGKTSDWNTSAMCFYTADKTYISGVALGKKTNVITAPANAAYARSTQSGAPASAVPLQFEEGDVETPYMPYHSVTRGDATWETGYIASGNMGSASFANTATSGKTYVDISDSTESPVLVSGDYMYINKGYTDNLKISLAKLVPDGASANLASGAILSGYSAYNNDGALVAGSIPSHSSATYNTSTTDQTIASGQYLSGEQTIKAVTTSGIDAGNIKDGAVIKVGDAGNATRIKNVTGTFTDASTVSSGQTAATAAQIRAGYSAWVNGTELKGSIADGSAATPTTTITANPSISVNSSGLITATTSATKSVTPTVSEGYVSSGTAGTITVSGSNTSQLSVQAAQTITPGTTDKTIASGKYLTGTQTIKGDANLIASNIRNGVTIFGVTGTHKGYTITETADAGGGTIVNITTEGGDVDAYSWIGKNAELIQTFNTVTGNLSDTTFPSWTASTTATTIRATGNLTTFTADMANYEYTIVWKCNLNVAYNEGATTKAIPYRSTFVGVNFLYRHPSSLTMLTSGMFDGAISGNYAYWFETYYNTSGTLVKADAPSYGLYFGSPTPTFTSTTADSTTITVKTPTLSARCSTTYFNTARKTEIDSENSTYTMQGYLYRINKDGSFRKGLINELVSYFNT